MADQLPCDAVIVSNVNALKKGPTRYHRIDSVLNIVEPLLGLNRAEGQTGHIRNQPGGSAFITGDPHDTIDYPIVDPEGRTGPRYNWIESGFDPNIKLGYLKDKPKSQSSVDAVVSASTLDGTGTMKGQA